MPYRALGRLRTSIDRTSRALQASTSLLDPDASELAIAEIAEIARAKRGLTVANGLSATVATDLAMQLTSIGRCG